MRRIPSLSISSALVVLVALSFGCRDSEIVAYRVPKEKDAAPDLAVTSPSSAPASAPASGDGMANTAVATATGASLTWQAAPGWQAKPAGGMRKGSYAVTNAAGDVADLSITAFPGDVGGEAANVNRWRGQLQLPPLSDAEVAGSLTRIDSHGLKIALVDLTNSSASPGTRMLGAMVPFSGATWFFKLLGPDSAVGPQQSAFVDFIKTIQPASAPSQP